MDSSGKHGRGRGAVGASEREYKKEVGASGRPKENGGRACSATVRHAGMCPAVAAGLEYDYSTRNEILTIAIRSISISILEVHKHCLGTVIIMFCRRPIT